MLLQLLRVTRVGERGHSNDDPKHLKRTEKEAPLDHGLIRLTDPAKAETVDVFPALGAGWGAFLAGNRQGTVIVVCRRRRASVS